MYVIYAYIRIQIIVEIKTIIVVLVRVLPVRGFTSPRFTSQRFTSARFTSLRFTSARFTSLRVASPRFTSLRFTSRRFIIPRFTSPRFPSTRFTSPHFTSQVQSSPRNTIYCLDRLILAGALTQCQNQFQEIERQSKCFFRRDIRKRKTSTTRKSFSNYLLA